MLRLKDTGADSQLGQRDPAMQDGSRLQKGQYSGWQFHPGGGDIDICIEHDRDVGWRPRRVEWQQVIRPSRKRAYDLIRIMNPGSPCNIRHELDREFEVVGQAITRIIQPRLEPIGRGRNGE